MPKKNKETAKVNLEEWTPERFLTELIDVKTGRNKPFTPENKAALYALSREEAIQLDPRIFARWKFAAENKEITHKAATTTNTRRKELKDWSVKVRELLGDPEIAQLMLNQKKLPKWLNVLDNPSAADVIVATLIAKAMTGDIRAVEELRKLGFGDKVVIDAGQSFFTKNALKLEIVSPDSDTKEMEKKEFAAPQEEMAAVVSEETQAEKKAPKPKKVSQNPKVMPSAADIPGEKVPASLQAEFDRQEQERMEKKPATDDHGIDRGLLNKITITKNKNRS